MQGGVIALIFAWLIGPRYGKYDRNGKIVHPIIPHNIPFVMLGTFILAFGWFGFNPGSSLAGTDLRIAVVAVNTMLASATGAVGATLWMWWVRTKKPDPSMMCNGMLAGLVAITCPCAFVSAGGASILGLVAGVLVVESVFFFDKLGIDDCVGAISVHGVNGAWGCLSLGLFADGTYGDGWNGVPGTVKGLFYGGGFGQLFAEFIGVTTCFVTLAAISLLVYYIGEALVGNRVSQEVEIEGLDLPEMGVPGYAGFVMDKQSETPMLKGDTLVPSGSPSPKPMVNA
jgi:Amt family ammonium transporter